MIRLSRACTGCGSGCRRVAAGRGGHPPWRLRALFIGGLHHAMPDRASGFCIYDDPALAIARARQAGRRVLYLDFDVHHGDGVQAIHADDPGVMTVSFHESGRYLFPGTGFVDELGLGAAAGTIVNVPFEPGTGEGPWWAAVESLVPALAAAFGPDLIVSQHGADGHAWDPLAHLRLTTTAMGRAARLVDAVAHRYAGGAWLSTGGGGYDAYRVVPRSWSLVWLAGAHRDAPDARAGRVARAMGDRGGPIQAVATAGDLPRRAERRGAARPAAGARRRGPWRRPASCGSWPCRRLLREAEDRGWWSALDELRVARSPTGRAAAPSVADGPVRLVSTAEVERMTLADRVLPLADQGAGKRLRRFGGQRRCWRRCGDSRGERRRLRDRCPRWPHRGERRDVAPCRGSGCPRSFGASGLGKSAARRGRRCRRWRAHRRVDRRSRP